MSNEEKSWTTLSSKQILETDWFTVREDEIERLNGTKGEYVVVERGPSVFILPVTAKDELYLIRQYRYPTDSWSWEIPAGAIDEGETPLEAAKRELLEETGLTADTWDYICEFPIAPALSTNIAHIFVAEGLEMTESNHTDEETITEVKKVSDQELLGLIGSGDMNDGPSLSALLLAMAHEAN